MQAAWECLAQDGEDDFSLREVSERCNVSLRTIYNAFESRDGLIAQALTAHHSSLFTDLVMGSDDSRNLAEAYEMCRRVAEETLLAPKVALATSRAYFTARDRTFMVTALRELPTSIIAAWLRSDEADREKVALFGEADLSRQFANSQWALIAEWVTGAISEADLVRQQSHAILAIALAFGNAAGRAEATRLLQVTSLPQ